MIRHKRALFLLPVPALILLALTMSEGSKAPSPATTDIASRNSSSAADRYQMVFETPTLPGVAPTVTASAASNRLLPGGAGLTFGGAGGSAASVAPTAGRGGTTGPLLPGTAVPAAVASITSPTQAVAVAEQTAGAAQQRAQAAIQQVQAATGGFAFEGAPSGVAQALPPSVFAQVCATLLSVKTRTNVQLSALEARFPFLTARLELVRAQINAQINAYLLRFGCSVISS